MTIRNLFIKSLPSIGISLSFLIISSVFVYFIGINDIDNNFPSLQELKGGGGVFFLILQGLIISMFYFIYWLTVNEVIGNIKEAWVEKILKERDWLNHKELFKKNQAVIISRFVVICLFIIQMLTFWILSKIGAKGLSNVTFLLSSISFLIFFLWSSPSLVEKAVNKLNSDSLFYKFKKLHNFFHKNKEISDNYYSKLNSEYHHLSHLRSKMQDFETIEVDTKLSKVKYFLLEIQGHLEAFKNKKVQFIISEIPEKVNRFYYGDTGFRSIRSVDYRPEFIALSEQVGFDFEELNPGIFHDFPHYYFDFHREQLNEKDIENLHNCISNVENINKNYSTLILNPKIAREIDEYFQ